MLISIHYPLADSRPFVAGETGVMRQPEWPAPEVPPVADHFVRSFGAVRPRFNGAVRGWSDEDMICCADRVVRFRTWLHRGGSHGPSAPRCVFRYFFSDGNAVAKYDLGVALQAAAPNDSLIAFANLEVAVGPPKSESVTSLCSAGNALAVAYLRASTSRQLPSPPLFWITAGMPLFFVQQDRAEPRLKLVAERKITSLAEQGIDLWRGWVPIRGMRLPAWLLVHTPETKMLMARDLRVGLVRHHVEIECLNAVLRHVAARRIDPEPRSPTSDVLQRYLNEATRLLYSMEKTQQRRFGSEFVALTTQVDYEVNPGVQEALSRRLSELDLRGNVIRKTITRVKDQTTPPTPGPVMTFAKGYAVSIGIAHYPKVIPLPETVLHDCEDIVKLLRAPDRCGYPHDQVLPLVDEKATLAQIRAALKWLADKAAAAGEDVTVLVYFSGHGGRVEDGPGAGSYLIPYDCDPSDLPGTALAATELAELLGAIHASRLLVILDACYSGGAGHAKAALASAQPALRAGLKDIDLARLAAGKGRVIMASSRSDEVSLTFEDRRNSLFTEKLLEAIDGRARSRGDGQIRVFDIFDYVSEAVPASGRAQHPIFKGDVENNFPVALYFAGKQVTAAQTASERRDTSVDERALRQLLVESFSLADLDLLLADVTQDLRSDALLGDKTPFNREMVGGTGKEEVILRMIEYAHNRGWLAYLVRGIRRARPGLV